MTRVYQYVGPRRIAEYAQAPIERLAPKHPDDIRGWSLAPRTGQLELTFIVDEGGQLWLSDRHSEHVACASGRPVLGAGELVLELTPDRVSVASVTNQSTGYCPEPECWPAIRASLLAAGLDPPDALTHAFDFRRCAACGTINVLKSEMPECPNCDAELPAAWNLADPVR